MSKRRKIDFTQPYAWLVAGPMLLGSLLITGLFLYQIVILHYDPLQPGLPNGVFLGVTCAIPAYELWRTKTIRLMGLSFRAAILFLFDSFFLSGIALSLPVEVAYMGFKALFIFYGPAIWDALKAR
jgi:hypothetical protein